MKDYCGNCEYFDLNQKEYWGERYYCSKTCKYKYKDEESCRLYTEKKDNGYKPAGCYITTIVCSNRGDRDNCEFLRNLRFLRENYLRKSPEGINLLREYDEIGPVISKQIENAPTIEALTLMNKFIIPASDYILKNNYEKATLVYKNMVNELKEKYSYEIACTEIDYSILTPVKDMGKGKLRLKPTK